MEDRSPIRVTAAIVRSSGNILLARRRSGSLLAGKWEFPGGKIEARETAEQCLARELHEEFGLHAEIGVFVASSRFQYDDREIELLAYEARFAPGDPSLTSHDAIAWVATSELLDYDLAPADVPIAEALIRLAAVPE